MTKLSLVAGLALAGTATAAVAAVPSIADLRHDHRILIVSGPAGNGDLAAQRRALAAWTKQGQDRDVATVVLDGTEVTGASDTAGAIRARYAVPSDAFAMALVGKDGHVAYRTTKLVTGDQLEQVIDAMPMRRAGQR